jgi:hypothetical protein
VDYEAFAGTRQKIPKRSTEPAAVIHKGILRSTRCFSERFLRYAQPRAFSY